MSRCLVKRLPATANYPKMVNDLCMEISIVPVAIVRDKNGLALSSRNRLLSDNEKQPLHFTKQAMQEIVNN